MGVHSDRSESSIRPAEKPIAINPLSVSPVADAVVAVMSGAAGAHVGLLYRADSKGTILHLHLAGHFRLKNEAPIADSFWISPRLDDFALADLRASASLIAKRQADGRVPFALTPVDAKFSDAGVLQLNGGYGLTCASFILLVFKHAFIDLVDVATWNNSRSAERKEEDEAAQVRLITYLRKSGATKHADLVEGDIGCTRIRAEEVAAAFGMDNPPVSFMRVELEGGRVLEFILASTARANPSAAPTEAIQDVASNENSTETPS